MKENEQKSGFLSVLNKCIGFFIRNKYIAIAVITAVILLVLGLTVRFGMKNKTRLKSDTVNKMIEKIQELSTINYHYTNVGSYEKQNELIGIKIPLTYKRFIVTYDGTMKIGINLKNIEVKIVDKEIMIKLPKPEILSNQMLEDSIRFFDQTSGIFNPLKLNEYTDFVKKLNAEALEKVEKSGIMKEAVENAKLALTNLLSLNPDIGRNYVISFVG